MEVIAGKQLRRPAADLLLNRELEMAIAIDGFVTLRE
jgi:hypothetical protein